MKVKIVILSACALMMVPLEVRADETFSGSTGERSDCYSAMIKAIDDQVSRVEVYLNCQDRWNYQSWGFRLDSRFFDGVAGSEIGCQRTLTKRLAKEVPGLVLHAACESQNAPVEWSFSYSK